MSIILKGVDLPKKGQIMVLSINDNETVMCRDEYDEWHYTDIEAIQIPKRARLIDAKDIDIYRWDIDTDLADQIRNAPTILESEVMPDE